MLRLLVAGLLLANLAFFSWTRGWLDDVVGARAQGDREPERLRQQIRPEVVRVLPDAPSSARATAPACLEAGPFATADVAAAEAALQTLVPAGTWVTLRTEKPGRWLVYMGPYGDRDTMLRKIDEIRRTRSEFEEVALPAEGPYGLALGRHDDRASADRGLVQAQQRGIRTARVVLEAPPTLSHMLRIERADPTVAATVAAARLPALGTGFAPCAESPTPR